MAEFTLSEKGTVLTIAPMRDLEAKDFLVQQTAEQAALEGVPLSDLEKRMMYFTETGEVREDAIDLNNALEAEYDTEQYETKSRSSCSTQVNESTKRIPKPRASGRKPSGNSQRGTITF